LIRILGFLAAIALTGFGIGWLIERPGSFVMVWQGWRVETSVPVALLFIVLLTTALIIAWWFLRTLIHVPDAITDFLRGRRRRRGMTAVAHGLMAVGIGDGRGARRSANDARRLLGDEPLTLLLRAQAAQLAGDRDEAESAFRAMLDQPETRPLGYRGLYVEARRRGDTVGALSLAERAVRANPNVPWAGPALLELQSAGHDWDGALASVERNAANKLIDKAAARRQRAVILTAKAYDLTDSGVPDEALDLAREAVKLAPGLIPAAALAGRLLAESGDTRRAEKTVEAAWSLMPHPDLAEVYVHVKSGESAAERLKRAAALAKRKPDDPESGLMLAKAALDAREFARARDALKSLVENGPTRRVCMLMAEIENAETGDLGRARAWLARALSARRDPAWVADGFVSDIWEAVSPVTGELDAFVWKVPQETLAPPGVPVFEQAAAPPAPAPSSPPVAATPAPQATPAAVVAPPPPAPVQPAPPPAAKPAPSRRPAEVLLPIARAPDDPGPDAPDADGDTLGRIESRLGPM